MDTNKFRKDVINYLETTQTTPFNLACAVGIESSAFYKFLRGKIGMSTSTAFKLWQFIYREPVRIKAVRPPLKRAKSTATLRGNDAA